MVQSDNTNKLNSVLNLVLLMLFLSSIALVCLKYNIITRVKNVFTPVNFSLDGKIVREYIPPNKVSIRFSRDSATVIHFVDQIYLDNFSSGLREAFLDDVDIKKVDLKTYQDAISSRNITFEYGDIPSKVIEKSIGLISTKLSNLGMVESITFLLGKDNPATIYIKTSDDIYEIEKDLENKVAEIENIEKSNYTSYYPVFDSLEKTSNILVPLNPIVTTKDIEFAPIAEDIGIDSLSRAVFDEKLDFTSFVRRDDFSYFYSYKNGQEIMSFSNDSLLEYKNNYLRLKRVITPYDAALIAVDFLNKLSLTGEISIYHIEEKEQASAQIINIYLKRNVDGVPLILFPDEHSERIQITNGMISECKIYMYDLSLKNTDKNNALYNPLDCLSQNSKEISKSLMLEGISKLTDYIEDVNMIYYLNNDGEISLAWLYKISGQNFIIDASTGEIVDGRN